MTTTATKATTLTFKQLMTIQSVLQDARREQAHATYAHDQVVKASLKGNPERLEYLVDVQQANYDQKQNLDHAFYAVEEMIREYQ